VVDEDSGQTLFPPYAVEKFDGIKVGFIGMTLEGTPDIVSPSGVAGLDFLDEAETADRYADELRRLHGVRAVVVLLHEGGVQSAPAGINECNGISGPIDGRAVTSASSFGRLLADVDLPVDRQSKDVVEVSANNQILDRALQRDRGAAARPRDRAHQRGHHPDARRLRENAAGNLIADAQLAATSSPETGGAVAAFMNPGGVRADFTFAQSGSDGDGNVTYGEAFTVQPFGSRRPRCTTRGAGAPRTAPRTRCRT
jgi:5'-nucleotidase